MKKKIGNVVGVDIILRERMKAQKVFAYEKGESQGNKKNLGK